MRGGAWSGVIFSTLSIVIPIGQHHGLIPAELPMFGSPVAPDTPSTDNGTSPHGPNIPTTPPPTGTVATAGEPVTATETGESNAGEGIHDGGAGNVG